MWYFPKYLFGLAAVLGAVAQDTSPLLKPIYSVPDPATACQRIAKRFGGGDITVHFSQYVPAGTTLSVNQGCDLADCNLSSQLVSVDLCRVTMQVRTSSRSQISMEAWLPTNWTGRFMSGGNGNLAGCIWYPDLAYASSFGFAAVGANGGHNGSSAIEFANNTDTVRDFSERSVHTGVVVGKNLTREYYGQAHKKSYYLACSTGGRQGFKAVQSFPEDFDGVVAGAPALRVPALITWAGRFFAIFGSPGSPTFIPPGTLWFAIHAEVLKQCDALDGVVDGIIENPRLCYFNPQPLLCADNQTSSNSAPCLTKPQIKALKQSFEDFVAPNGEFLYPRMEPGSEIIASFAYYTSGVFPVANDWFRYVVYNDSSFVANNLTYLDAQRGNAQNPFNVLTFNGDISAFKNRGGKVLHYHGVADPIVSPGISPWYYNHVSQTMGLSPQALDKFYRFFFVGGLDHCGGGVGAHAIGQSRAGVSVLNPQNNLLLRIIDWVENGNAPDTITGTKFVNDDPSQGVSFVRNHCRYPKKNICVDTQNYRSASAWKCL